MVTASPNWAAADEDYSHMVYTATAFMHWCEYKAVPKSIADFEKVTDVNDHDPRITLDPDQWFRSVQFKVEGNKLKIIRVVEVKQSDKVSTKRTSISTSNCASVEVIKKNIE